MNYEFAPEAAKPPYSGTVYNSWAKTGRRYVTIKLSSGISCRRAYARYVYETTTGEFIPDGLEVDHIDNNCLNDDFTNLQLLDVAANRAKSAAVRGSALLAEFKCDVCGVLFTRQARNLAKPGVARSYSCSHKCGCERRKLGLPITVTEPLRIFREIPPIVRELSHTVPKLRVPAVAVHCTACGIPVSKKAKFCMKCTADIRRGVATRNKYPPNDELVHLLTGRSLLPVANGLGVSDNSLRKWLLRQGLKHNSKTKQVERIAAP